MGRFRRQFLADEAAIKDAKFIYDLISAYLVKYIYSIPYIEKIDSEERISIIKHIETCEKLSFLTGIEHELKDLYAFCRADSSKDLYEKYVDDHASDLYNKILMIIFGNAASLKLRVLPHVDMESFKSITPRLYYAFKVAFARKALYSALKDDVRNTLSSVDAALLSDMAYTYIIQRIKKGVLPAKKINRQWQIPIKDALSFIIKYYPSEMNLNPKTTP